MGNTATIDLVFNTFVDNANTAPSGGGAPAGPFCVIRSLTLNDSADGQVSLSGTGATTTIRVRQNNTGNNPVFIKITVSRGGDPTNYNPQSMVFVGTTDPDGSVNFPKGNRNPFDQTITFKNTCTNKASTSWKYYIQIKQMNSSGVQPLGWIDPDVQNDN